MREITYIYNVSKVGTDIFVLPLLTFEPEAPEHCRFAQKAIFSLILRYFRKYRENTAKIRQKYGENKQKLTSQSYLSVDFRFSLPPAQESLLGNNGNVPVESDRAGMA